MILTCYTIGHSKHTIEQFVSLIKPYNVNLVIDVRSIPFSRHAPQFNLTVIKQKFYQFDLEYEYMGDVIGGKFNDSEFLNEDGCLDFYKIIKKESFQKGIDTVIEKNKSGSKIVLMCAEKDPLYCHRFLLVSRELTNRGVEVIHLLANGSAIGNDELVDSIAFGKNQSGFIQEKIFYTDKREYENRVYQLLMMKKSRN